jgi:hypothetical protein
MVVVAGAKMAFLSIQMANAHQYQNSGLYIFSVALL